METNNPTAPNAGKIWRWLAHAVLGYFIAVPVASIIAVFVLVVLETFDSGIARRNFFNDIPGLIFIGIIMTGATAWPGYLATIIIGQWKKIDHALFYGVGGILTAIFALLISDSGNIDSLAKNIVRMWYVTPAGFLGALAYTRWKRWFYPRA